MKNKNRRMYTMCIEQHHEHNNNNNKIPGRRFIALRIVHLEAWKACNNTTKGINCFHEHPLHSFRFVLLLLLFLCMLDFFGPNSITWNWFRKKAYTHTSRQTAECENEWTMPTKWRPHIRNAHNEYTTYNNHINRGMKEKDSIPIRLYQ